MTIDNFTTAQLEACAHAAHEVIRAYCRTLGDHSQEGWDDAPDWQRRSARDGVLLVITDNPTPEQTHANWSRHKIADGWKLGPVKDAEKKEHPCLVPYAELPAEQQIKDALFTMTVKGMLDMFWRAPQ